MIINDPPELEKYLANLLGLPHLGTPYEIQNEGRAAWNALHSKKLGDPVWFAEWQKTIPRGCTCKKESDHLLQKSPPRFGSDDEWFDWTVEYHNSVNAKLGKPLMRPDVAKSVWRYEEESSQWDTVSNESDFVIVTSLSLLPHHQAVQSRCLKSWMRLGRRIISGNTPNDIKELQTQYPNVRFLPVSPSQSFDRPLARIHELMQLGDGKPVLLINSDIEILGDGSLIAAAANDGRALAGLRYNWKDHRGNANLEQWGIDAFLLHPKQIATFPSLDFAIGETMWDYWIPYHFSTIGEPLEWIGEPYFYHESHPVHWRVESLDTSRAMLSPYYNTPATSVFWTAWRRMQPFHS